jgi:hypothetical protein
MTENKIIAILAETGPLTGAQLVEHSGIDVLLLWQICRKIPAIIFETAARRYLRLDRSIQGYARLSPSIRREFLTYTFVGLESQAKALVAKAEALKQETKHISQAKEEMARQTIVSALARLPDIDVIMAKSCFFIAGDVVYEMAHTVPRPEKSTGEMVQGSDLDIIIAVEDDLDPKIIGLMDNAIHKRKHLLLVNDREEIDYIIKPISRIREQLEFDIFPSMVAAKILDEGRHLYGNPVVYRKVKNLLTECGIPEKLKSLERQAIASRELAESQLPDINAENECAEYLNLFYTHAEEDEIY